MPAHRCSTCNLNYPVTGRCQVCNEQLSFLSNANETEDLEEQISIMTRVAEPLVPEPEKIYRWRREELVRAGCPIGYAKAFARDREFELGRTREVVKGCIQQHGEERGFELALEILL